MHQHGQNNKICHLATNQCTTWSCTIMMHSRNSFFLPSQENQRWKKCKEKSTSIFLCLQNKPINRHQKLQLDTLHVTPKFGRITLHAHPSVAFTISKYIYRNLPNENHLPASVLTIYGMQIFFSGSQLSTASVLKSINCVYALSK